MWDTMFQKSFALPKTKSVSVPRGIVWTEYCLWGTFCFYYLNVIIIWRRQYQEHNTILLNKVRSPLSVLLARAYFGLRTASETFFLLLLPINKIHQYCYISWVVNFANTSDINVLGISISP